MYKEQLLIKATFSGSLEWPLYAGLIVFVLYEYVSILLSLGYRGRRGCDRMVLRFITTYVISAYRRRRDRMVVRFITTYVICAYHH